MKSWESLVPLAFLVAVALTLILAIVHSPRPQAPKELEWHRAPTQSSSESYQP